MEWQRLVAWHVLVAMTILLPASWHAGASLTGRCEGAHRYSGEHSCGAALAAYNVSVHLLGNIAEVLVNETFANDGSHIIEDASVTLVIPAGVVLLGFKTQVAPSDDLSASTLHGRIRLRQTGLPSCSRSSKWGSFSEGVSSTHPGSLRLSVGSIPPGGVVHVQIEYAQELKAVVRPGKGGAFRLQLQMPTGPRRKPASHKKDGQDSSMLEARVNLHDQECRTNACATSPLQIRSPSHSTYLQVIQLNGMTIAGYLKVNSFQDIVLEVGPAVGRQAASNLQASLFIEQHSETGLSAALLSLPASVAPSSFSAFEVVLILDRSHSMSGARLDRVRQAVQTFLRSLPMDVTFNFIGLETAESLLFESSSKPLNKESFDAAVKHLSSKSADAHTTTNTVSSGASKALSSVFKSLTRSNETQLRIVFITDRQVADAEAALQEITAGCSMARCQLSTVGLGWGASPQFVESAARAGHGMARFVAERGSVEPLERALVTQLAEALQLQVSDVEVDWHPLRRRSDGKYVTLSTFRERSSSQEIDIAKDAELQGFLSQGGVRELQPVQIGAASTATGERLLGLSFLGSVATRETLFNASIRVRARVGGMPFEASASVAASWIGRALHAICARRFVDDATSAKVDQHDSQLRALGLAYALSTAQTQWSAIPGRGNDQRSLAALLGKDDSACATADGMSALQGGSPSSIATSGRAAFTGDGSWESDPSKARRLQADSELSLRRPPAVAAAEAGKLSIQGLLHISNKLSVIDFADVGASVSLRSLPSPFGSREGRGPLDMPGMASSMSLRNFMGFGPDAAAHMGSSFSLKHMGRAPWWGGGYGDDLDSDFGDPAFARYGPGQMDKMGKKTVPKGVESSLSLRSLCRCGASFSMFALQRFPSQLSALDFAHLGSSLSLRKLHKPGNPSSHRYGAYPGHAGGSFSTLDYMFLGSSLSLSGASFGRRALSLHGASRFNALDQLGFGGLDGGLDDFGSDRRGLEKGSSLSLRSFSRIGKMLSVIPGAALPDCLAAKLSVVDLANLGSSLSLRRPDRGGDRNPFGRRNGFGPFGGPDYGRLGSSMSVHRLARFPGDVGYDEPMDFSEPSLPGSFASLRSPRGLGDVGDVRGSVADDSKPLDADADLEARFGGARLPDAPKVSMRSAGRIGGLGGALPSEASTRRNAGDEDGRPDAWVGIGVTGGLVVPVLPVFRSGAACRPSQQSATVFWRPLADAGDGKKKKRRPAAVYTATGPLIKGGTARLTELVPPKEDDGAEGKVELSLALSIQLSQSCMLTARPSQKLGSTASAADSAALFEISLAREDFPAGTAPSSDALRAALLAHHRASIGETKGGIADPLRVEVFSASAADGGKGMQTLTGLQRFDGAFDLSKTATKDMSSMGLLSSQLAAFVAAWGSSEIALAVSHTAVSVAILRTRYVDFEDSWGMLAKKAEAWLAGKAGSSADSAPAVVAGCHSAEACIAAAEMVVARWVGAA